MRTLGKVSFILAPVLLFASFFGAMLQSNMAMAVCIVLATVSLALALLCKVLEVHGAFNTKKEDKP
ncbi:MAG: hypothetical protein MR004_03825 [Clostridiales bacterium]|nr:hypothetical protein [bacterium 210917-SL.2.15]MCI5842777.1 hypothetical protein [Clostridiales bacterium]MDY4036754.1 hypothetical protein [Candidatus Pseudoscilispira sp.]